jgi:hypothetical protein
MKITKTKKKLVSFIVLASYYFNHLPFAATSSIQYYDRESGDLKRKSGCRKVAGFTIIIHGRSHIMDIGENSFLLSMAI